jgi:putative membrane protein
MMNLRAITSIAAAALFTIGCVSLNRPSDFTRFRDPEAAMVIHVANLAEVREGDLARDRAASQAVKEFAAMMASEHAQAASRIENELAKKEIPSADSDLSRQIDAESGKAVDALRTRTGADFDRAYMERTVTFHGYLIDLIDKTVKPAAKKKEVHKALDETRALAVKHLARAEEIRKGL